MKKKEGITFLPYLDNPNGACIYIGQIHDDIFYTGFPDFKFYCKIKTDNDGGILFTSNCHWLYLGIDSGETMTKMIGMTNGNYAPNAVVNTTQETTISIDKLNSSIKVNGEVSRLGGTAWTGEYGQEKGVNTPIWGTTIAGAKCRYWSFLFQFNEHIYDLVPAKYRGRCGFYNKATDEILFSTNEFDYVAP